MGKVTIIGSGFAGLASAIELADKGCDVNVFEKNDQIGGRARKFEAKGFVFDMGPSWYWMPDVMENFFGRYGKNIHDYLNLVQLDPGFRIFFEDDEIADIPADQDELIALIEKWEPGASKKFEKFMAEAKKKYEVSLDGLIYQPSYSVFEFAKPVVMKNMFSLHLLQSFHSYVRKYFKDSRLIRLMEFPILFLGALPQNTPALYSIMNYAGLGMGTWYPMGGFHELVSAMGALAEEKGVQFHTGVSVDQIKAVGNLTNGISAKGESIHSDGIIASADYEFVERQLLPEEYRNYGASYWKKKTFAPSCLIFYVGVNQKVANLEHHNLFFDTDFGRHAHNIYTDKKWPESPLFYVCAPSKTDATVAPDGQENLFFLVPIATGLEDTESVREEYFDQIVSRLEKRTGVSIKENIVYKRSYCVADFQKDYNSFQGNAYGLANTLRQTAMGKPTMRNKKLKNLFYTGQLTVPGPGVPPSIISGQVAAGELLKFLKK